MGGYYTDNGREFKNVKMDELVSKLGITIRYGPAYSPWSNGTNERNHASCDITIKKILEDKKTGLKDAVMKTAAFTHNTSVNKAGFSPLQLVKGKAANIPALTMGNEGSESLTDAEAVNRIMETRSKITQEFREAETRKKIKDCQKIPVRNYQHHGNYIAGDKIWFQHNKGNAWHGPAEVVYQKGNAIFAYFNGEMKKVAMCRVKPYELIERIEEETKKNDNQEETPEIIEETIETENDEKIENSETTNNNKQQQTTTNNNNQQQTTTTTTNNNQQQPTTSNNNQQQTTTNNNKQQQATTTNNNTKQTT